MRRFNLEIICRDIMTKFVNKDTDIGDYNIKKNGQAIPPPLGENEFLTYICHPSKNYPLTSKREEYLERNIRISSQWDRSYESFLK